MKLHHCWRKFEVFLLSRCQKSLHFCRCVFFFLILAESLRPAATSLLAADSLKTAPVSFNREIRPIFSAHCYACHGPDAGQRKAGLRLDVEEEALKPLQSGGRAVVPGDPIASALMSRITAEDPDDRMPPPEHEKPLSSKQIDTLKRWIGEGAQWERHWAYLPPKRPALPPLQQTGWARNEIDHFIQAEQEKRWLEPSPEAPKAKLIRRASLDLIGLPPSVAEIEAFLENDSEEAYDQLIDRLLDSKHYGERQALFWLDLARYGETQGFHHDRHRDMWHWRDWVIRAYNENKPFDEFTIEQLAGDLLPNSTPEQKIATGFHRNEMTTSEGGALPEEYSVKYVVGRVDTTARVWLGTSLACAECHDHKYDPISQEDYYRFFAYFNNVPEDGLDKSMNPRPRLSLKTSAQEKQIQTLAQEINALELAYANLVNSPNETYNAGQKHWMDKLENAYRKNWRFLEPWAATAANRSELAWNADHIITASGTIPNKEIYTIDFYSDLPAVTGIRLEAIPDGTSGKIGRAKNGDFVLTRLEVFSRSAIRAQLAGASSPAFAQWRLIGPFGSGIPSSQLLDTIFGPETHLDFNAAFGEERQQWSDPIKDLNEALKALEGKTGVLYLAGTIAAQSSTETTLRLNTPLPHRLWVNLAEILAPMENETLKISLQKGQNSILLKLAIDGAPPKIQPTLLAEQAPWKPVKLKAAAASRERPRYGIQGALDDKIETGWSVWEKEPQNKDREYAWFQTDEPLGAKSGNALRVRLSFHSPLPQRLLGKFRLAVTDSAAVGDWIALPQNIRTDLIQFFNRQSSEPPPSLQVHYRENFIEEARQLKKLINAKKKERADFENSLPVAMVMGERQTPKDTFVLIRGEYNNPGKKVETGLPSALYPEFSESPEQKANNPTQQGNRLDLARWIVDPGHPLTSRVIVNHYWQQFFGTGIVKTAEDFGSQGEWPSHPKLLDWLAREFVESGWNIKHMHKLILTSATYRQDSTILPQHLRIDPENQKLARFPRTRLEAEAIRDLALFTGGLLDPTIGGESVYPYQPPGLWEQLAFQGTRKWEQSKGVKNYRRGLYVYWRRSVPYASFVTFDAPSRETCTVQRPRTNTPLQALVLMNDPVYIEAARSLGLRILTEGGPTPDDKIRFACQTVLSRPPLTQELNQLRQAYLDELRHFESNRIAANQLIHVGASEPPLNADISKLAAWTIIGNILLNLDETITKN